MGARTELDTCYFESVADGVVLLTLNWRLALTALAIVPGVMVLSLTFAKRVRPIYRSLRKDVEQILGRLSKVTGQHYSLETVGGYWLLPEPP